MTLETRVREAFASMEQYPLSSDLFTRIQASIDDDIQRRRRWRRVWVAIGTMLALIGTTTLLTLRGGITMPWWTLELIATGVLVGIGLFIGPMIRRFGKAYAADVFRANPSTGKSFIVLTDFAYYMIVAAYVLLSSRFEPDPSWLSLDGGQLRAFVTAAQLQAETVRVGGLLLILGVLHGMNLIVLPVVGRLFTLNLRLDRDLLEDRNRRRD